MTSSSPYEYLFSSLPSKVNTCGETWCLTLTKQPSDPGVPPKGICCCPPILSKQSFGDVRLIFPEEFSDLLQVIVEIRLGFWHYFFHFLHQDLLVGGFKFQPIWKIWVKLGSSSPNRREHRNHHLVAEAKVKSFPFFNRKITPVRQLWKEVLS